MSLWPIAIIEDRYMGTYSGGKWIAIANWREDSRLELIEDEGNGGDCEARDFWYEPPSWAAVGDTPDAALAKLKSTNKSGDGK